MHEQLHDIKSEKNYWLERLTRTENELILKSTKRKRKIKPITKSKFMNFHKKHLQNRSVLAKAGMLFLDTTLHKAPKRGRGFHTLSDLGNTWVRATTESPTRFKRTEQLHARTLNGTGYRPNNFEKTIGIHN
jgi:hypothetical protein